MSYENENTIEVSEILVEAMARAAHYDAMHWDGTSGPHWSQLSEDKKAVLCSAQRAALAAMFAFDGMENTGPTVNIKPHKTKVRLSDI